jgi:hypothetical protein
MLPPNRPASAPMPSPASPGQGEPQQGGGEVSPDQARQAIMQGVQLLKQAAQKYGISTQELMAMFAGGAEMRPPAPPPARPGGAPMPPRQMPLPGTGK